MRYVNIREFSRNPSRFIGLDDTVLLTKRGKPIRALVSLQGEEIEDFIRRLKPDPIQAAKDFGIDLTLLYENLKLSPTERLKKHQEFHSFVDSIRGIAWKKHDPV